MGNVGLYIRAKWPVVDESASHIEGAKVMHFETERIEIEADIGPLWLEHPEVGSVCDVVAIPFQKPTNWPKSVHKAANKMVIIP